MRHDAVVGPEADAIARHRGRRVERHDERRLVAGAELQEVDVARASWSRTCPAIEQEHDRRQVLDRLARHRIAHQARHRQLVVLPRVAERHELERRVRAHRGRACVPRGPDIIHTSPPDSTTNRITAANASDFWRLPVSRGASCAPRNPDACDTGSRARTGIARAAD